MLGTESRLKPRFFWFPSFNAQSAIHAQTWPQVSSENQQLLIFFRSSMKRLFALCVCYY